MVYRLNFRHEGERFGKRCRSWDDIVHVVQEGGSERLGGSRTGRIIEGHTDRRKVPEYLNRILLFGVLKNSPSQL